MSNVRRKSGVGPEGVVLRHGLARSARSMWLMARRLEAAGFAVRNIGYPSRRKPLDDLADDIHCDVDSFSRACGGTVHFVTHSMGGLVARIYLSGHRPEHLGRVVMLGPPNHGSEVADLLRNLALYRSFYGPAGQQVTPGEATVLNRVLGAPDYLLGVIAGRRPLIPVWSASVLPGPNDGTVTVEATKVDGMGDHLIVDVSHSWLILSRICADATVAFLKTGSFSGLSSTGNGPIPSPHYDPRPAAQRPCGARTRAAWRRETSASSA